ncbi:uncharacterized protein TNCV_4765881 [Trichonephila clavipes]|nr:uncharacterized protein TNCV_4765881 [Trichonephila clavipes]
MKPKKSLLKASTTYQVRYPSIHDHEFVTTVSLALPLKWCGSLERFVNTATRGLLATDHVILNHGQVTWTTPELAPPSPNYHTTPHQREDVSALDRFNVHRCPTRRVFSGTGLEPVTKQATVRYLYHSATAATRETGAKVSNCYGFRSNDPPLHCV